MNGLPLGATIEALSVRLLRELYASMDDPLQSEYLLVYAFNPAKFHCEILEAPEHLKRPYYSVTVDTEDDLKTMEALFAACCTSTEPSFSKQGPSLETVVAYLDKHPSLARLDANTLIKLPNEVRMEYGAFLQWMRERANASRLHRQVKPYLAQQPLPVTGLSQTETLAIKEQPLAVYTTIYPGCEAYLASWYASVAAQTDPSFDLWIGLDGVTPQEAAEAIGSLWQKQPLTFNWVEGTKEDTWATLRDRAIIQMTLDYPAVVFVDSDDILMPERIAEARKALLNADMTACRLSLIDERGQPIGLSFPAENAASVSQLAEQLPYANAFGLSNTAYRSTLLRQCIPLPENIQLIDWYLASRAWLLNARIHYDERCLMAYRQYANNIARILPPFTEQGLSKAFSLVLTHYETLRPYALENTHALSALDEAVTTVAQNQQRFENDSHWRTAYLQYLNETTKTPWLWWHYLTQPAPVSNLVAR